MMGAPSKPTAVAVPVTNPTRESEGREGGRTECVIIVNTSWESQILRQGHIPQSDYGQHKIRNRRICLCLFCSLKNLLNTILMMMMVSIARTCLRKTGTAVWESSLVFVSKVCEVSSL